jgi:hypothetical protein
MRRKTLREESEDAKCEISPQYSEYSNFDKECMLTLAPNKTFASANIQEHSCDNSCDSCDKKIVIESYKEEEDLTH